MGSTSDPTSSEKTAYLTGFNAVLGSAADKVESLVDRATGLSDEAGDDGVRVVPSGPASRRATLRTTGS